MHTPPGLVVYECFNVDLKQVGISDLGAFLITNGSCVMTPIMSVVQQGGCYPSCRLAVEKQIICPTAFVDSGFPSPTLLICVCLWVFSPVVLSSGLSGSLGLAVLSSPPRSPHPLLLLLPSASRAKTSGGIMPLQKEPVNACPTCQAKYLSLGVPPLTSSSSSFFSPIPLLLLLSYCHPHPVSLRTGSVSC